jgi:RNA polymerase sigma factor (sigma-70 family)
MEALRAEIADRSFASSSLTVGDAGSKSSNSDLVVRPWLPERTASQSETWEGRSERWGLLMIAAQGGETRAYDQLLRELDAWLRRYFARRLPHPAAEDARQNALLAIHVGRNAYSPSRPFGAWVAGIARYKWIDRIRDASRFATLALPDEIPIEDHEESAISAVAVDELLSRLKPAQASVIRLVKLQDVSIESASHTTGQSIALVKVNIHRGLKKLAALVACDVVVTTSSPTSRLRGLPSSHSKNFIIRKPAQPWNRASWGHAMKKQKVPSETFTPIRAP